MHRQHAAAVEGEALRRGRAGGIVSAALDGLRVAEAVARRLGGRAEAVTADW